MNLRRKRPAFGMIAYFVIVFGIGAYFAMAAIQGDFGVFKRVQINAEVAALEAELLSVSNQVADLENRTHRLSDNYLDLDLLDEQARSILGMIRPDEIVIR